MTAAALAALAFLLGVVAGVLLVALLWNRMMAKPVNAQRMLRAAYQAAHPHGLQVSADDPTAVCPCCGWHEDWRRIPLSEDVGRGGPVPKDRPS